MRMKKKREAPPIHFSFYSHFKRFNLKYLVRFIEIIENNLKINHQMNTEHGTSNQEPEDFQLNQTEEPLFKHLTQQWFNILVDWETLFAEPPMVKK